MAYGDYQDTSSQIRQPTFQPSAPTGPTAMRRHPLMDALQGAQPQQGQAAPSPAGTLPTNTRQNALQQVQQAYQTPTTYSPGQGVGMHLGGFLGQMAATPSLSDSALQPIVAAGRMADQRGFDRNRAALMEQLGAQGLGDSGGANVGVGKLRQQMGESQAMRESGLLLDETQARRNALLAGLGLDQGRYQFDQGAGIQLAQLEALLNQQAVQPFLSY